MTTTSSNKDTEVRACPYLHQLQMDWLSMDSDGFYCHGYGGRVKVLNGGMCTFADFTSCSEYQRTLDGRGAGGSAEAGDDPI